MPKEITKIEPDKALEKFVKFINQAPAKGAVRNSPIAAGVKYIAIGDIETMLDKVFKVWNVEILREGQLLNSVFVTVRVHYKHPVLGEWQHQDGIGAVAIQTDKGKSAADISAIKSNAIMLALPSAKSYAIKDAVEHIGKAFGRDINRKDVLAFGHEHPDSFIAPTNQLINVAEVKQLQDKVEECTGLTGEQGEYWFKEITNLQYSQVRKFEFNEALKAIEGERTV